MKKVLVDSVLNFSAIIGTAITGITKSDISFYITLLVAVSAIALNIARLLDWHEKRKDKKIKIKKS